MLKIKKFSKTAKLPTVANPGEDLGFDLYSDEEVVLYPNRVVKVKTGIAAKFISEQNKEYGLIVKDRSSMAAKNITVSGGVIDAGYTNEISVMLTLHSNLLDHVNIPAGTKIAQLIPIEVHTKNNLVQEVEVMDISARGMSGFGSSGI